MFIIPVVLEIVLGLSFVFMKGYTGSSLLIVAVSLALIFMYIGMWGKGNFFKAILKVLLIAGHAMFAWHGYIVGNWVAVVCAVLIALFVIYLCVDVIASRFK